MSEGIAQCPKGFRSAILALIVSKWLAEKRLLPPEAMRFRFCYDTAMPCARSFALGLALCCLLSVAMADELLIYFLDVDGGQATLVVVDGKASMLVDAGWPGFEGRDTEKILTAAKDAGISRLDVMFTTHYHTDHVGGVPQLAAKLPIDRFVDHGPVLEKSENASRLYQRYLEVRNRGQHQRVSAGDSFRLGDATIKVVSARKELIQRPLQAKYASGSPAACKDGSTMPGDGSENEMSVGTVLEYGLFRFLNLADLLWNEEQALVCPQNKIGEIDLMLSTHHGFRTSNNPVLTRVTKPRVVVMNNGAKKGGDPERWRTIRALRDFGPFFWQTQKSVLDNGSHNVPDDYIAALEPQDKPAWIKVIARKDGSFQVSNSRNGKTVYYRK